MILYLSVTFALSFLLTSFLRFYAIKKNLIDIPGHRSSHSIPTPRGGGVSIVTVFVLVLISFTALGWLPLHRGILVLIALTMVAVIGWLDDHGHIRATIRISIHLLSSGIITYAFGGLPSFEAFGFALDLSYFGYLIALLSLTWCLNLFNFMDGIDGLASTETITTTLVAGFILYFIFGEQTAALLHFFLASSVLGFAFWNFPPAKIFMGDAASGFLGLTHGMLILFTSHLHSQMLWVWLILLGVFFVDATVTLVRRMIRGDKVYEAHRSHAYQWASRIVGSHKKVTVAVFLLNLLWLTPLAFLVVYNKLDGAFATMIAYLPLIFLALKFKAGIQEE